MFVFRKIWRAFVFLKHSFWDSPFCLITDEVNNEQAIIKRTLHKSGTPIVHQLKVTLEMGTAEAENVDIYSVCVYNLFSWKLFIKWILIPCMNGVQFRVILLYFFWFETHQTITCSKINFQSVRGMQGWTNLPLRTRFFGHAILLARSIRLSKKGCTIVGVCLTILWDWSLKG